MNDPADKRALSGPPAGRDRNYFLVLALISVVAALLLYAVVSWEARSDLAHHGQRSATAILRQLDGADPISPDQLDTLLGLNGAVLGIRHESPAGRTVSGAFPEGQETYSVAAEEGDVTVTVAVRERAFVDAVGRRFLLLIGPLLLSLAACTWVTAWFERRRRALLFERGREALLGLEAANYEEPIDAEALGVLGPALERLRAVLIEEREELNERNEELEASAQLKTRFLANMSHEIRTPLTAILGFTELLDDDSLTAERRQRSLDTVRRNGRHLLLIVNDVLDLSKIQAGRMTVERIPVALREIVQDIEEVFAPRAQSRQLTFDVSVEDSVPRLVDSDPTRLRQILANLVSNALKFTSEGEVQIRVSADAGEDAHGETEVLFRVRDTGIGMSDEAQRRIFEPFMQADNSVTRRYGGTGLGLAISRQLAELLGGELTCRSRKGEGAEFFLTIKGRVSRSASQILDNPSERESSAGDAEGQRVLVVEDSRDNQILIELLLKKYGAQVEVADNGKEGLAAIHAATERGRPFHLILMDMQMPVMDGYEATRRIREDDDELPVVALTAHALAGDRERCLRAGCSDFLSKPINRDALFRVLEEYGVRARS